MFKTCYWVRVVTANQMCFFVTILLYNAFDIMVWPFSGKIFVGWLELTQILFFPSIQVNKILSMYA